MGGVMIKNNRRRLQQADSSIGQGGMYVARQKRRKERLEKVRNLLIECHDLFRERERMEQHAEDGHFHEAIRMNARLLHKLRSERFAGSDHTNMFSKMREELRSHLEDMKQELRERSMRAAAEAEVDFDAARYEEVLDALGASGIGTPSHIAASHGDFSGVEVTGTDGV